MQNLRFILLSFPVQLTAWKESSPKRVSICYLDVKLLNVHKRRKIISICNNCTTIVANLMWASRWHCVLYKFTYLLLPHCFCCLTGCYTVYAVFVTSAGRYCDRAYVSLFVSLLMFVVTSQKVWVQFSWNLAPMFSICTKCHCNFWVITVQVHGQNCSTENLQLILDIVFLLRCSTNLEPCTYRH